VHRLLWAVCYRCAWCWGSVGPPWANCVDQDKTNFENLYDLLLLYLEAATKWLETEYGTKFATKTEVGPVKLLSISVRPRRRNWNSGRNWNCLCKKAPAAV
jgi:hypothetical protein